MTVMVAGGKELTKIGENVGARDLEVGIAVTEIGDNVGACDLEVGIAVTEIRENVGARDLEVGIAVTTTAVTTERGGGKGLVPVLDPGPPSVLGAGGGTSELMWRSPPSLWSPRSMMEKLAASCNLAVSSS